MSLLMLIKQAATEAVDASNPVGVFFGTIKSATPLEVDIDQRFVLTQEFLILTDATKELKYGDYVFRPKLQAGDRVLLMRIQGGQKYVILDRVRDT
ncbi:DUF2577 domain-containing protein [Brevibacillus formosus]|uniref:DUF2577 domain-containing protein n=1 Tax=Brevibacillus formosus TaxID=54913 RepID=UPI0018CE3E80|nr:DUF2577 domain-containing protein [Brevibacillus formosus]